MTLPHRDFCLIRHGQTDANRDGIIAGRTEAQLTEAGRTAARALAAWAWPGPIALWSSPQDRALETARLAFPGHRIRVLDALRERHWGIYEGRPVAGLPPRLSTPDGGEGWDDMLTRIRTALAFCITGAGDALPVMVAHSGVIRAARALTGGDAMGPSAPNATPLYFTAHGAGWHERALAIGGTP